MFIDGNSSRHKDVFDSTKTVKEHLEHLKYDRKLYEDTIEQAIKDKLNITSAVKAHILVALWSLDTVSLSDKIKCDKSLFDKIWSTWDLSAADIFKFIQLLDAPREARAIEQRLHEWDTKKVPVKKFKRTRLEIRMKSLKENEHTGNLTSSLAKRIRRWVNKIPSDQLDYYILNYVETLTLWKQLADVCHLKETDFQNSYFLSVVFGKEIPADTRLYAMKNINTVNFAETIRKYPDITNSYSYLRQKVKSRELRFTPESSKEFAKTAPLSDLIWFYEELQSSELDDIISCSLDRGETISSDINDRTAFPAKLMERILTLQKRKAKFVDKLVCIAEERLGMVTVPERDKFNIAILGDCSSSMSVAVETSTIVSSLLSVGLNADLIFFNDKVIKCPLPENTPPRTVKEVLQVARSIHATNCTSPASALLYYYMKPMKKIDLFIVVTDEEENTAVCSTYLRSSYGYNGVSDGVTRFNFAQLFKKYKNDVHRRAKVMFISFLDVKTKGDMVTDLNKILPEVTVKQYRLDRHLPDLSKFSELIGVVRNVLKDV